MDRKALATSAGSLESYYYYYCMLFTVIVYIIFVFTSSRVCVDGHTQTVVPTDVRSCVKPRRCITSNWTPWVEDVNFPCGGNGRRLGRLTRQRKIEQLPLGVHVCPHLIDVKPRLASAAQAPPVNATTTACQPQYQLVASGWSDCQVVDLSGNRAICGGGLQDRNISCLSLNQNRLPQPVDFGFCSHLPQLARLQRYEPNTLLFKKTHSKNTSPDLSFFFFPFCRFQVFCGLCR